MRRAVIATDTGSGRLANQLWHYAKVATWCREHGLPLVHSGMLKFGREFGSGHAFGVPGGTPCRLLGRVSYGRRRKLLGALARSVERVRAAQSIRAPEFGDRIDLAALPCPTRPFTVLRGWYFDNPEGLTRHREYAVRSLAPAAAVAQRAAECLGRAEPGAIRVGVHIRAGDYRTWNGGRYLVPSGEYLATMQRIATGLPGKHVRFLVASDEALPPDVLAVPGVIPGPGDAAGDLAMLSGSDMVVSTWSTFAMWAAYVGDAPLLLLRQRPGEERGLSIDEACDAVAAGRRTGHFARAILDLSVQP